MKNQDIIFSYLSCNSIRGNFKYTQLGLSRELGISLSIVNSTIKSLAGIGAIRINRRSFELISLNRLLLYWATHRVLRKDFIYLARADMAVRDIERNMPDEVAFTGCTAYRFLFEEAPADYSEVYVYASEKSLKEIQKRFPKRDDRNPNLFVLKSNSVLEEEIRLHKLQKSCVCEGQLFVDLWNMNQWYAKEYADALAKRLEL